MKHIPWVEKYRPKYFDNIVLDDYNKKILTNIVSKKHFPNLLFYGPPGTGKTTSIVRLIEKYQEAHSKISKEHIIHLNASDERGIDVIRNQIKTFVNSQNLFIKGLKFVILDEVDYMTKSAQQALKFLLQENNNNVRFCLICNYISKIEMSLQNEFVKLRFNELPNNEIINFLKTIVKEEKLSLNLNKLKIIQNMFGSDLRSMINFLQLNGNDKETYNNFLDDNLFKKIYIKLSTTNIQNNINYIKKVSNNTNCSEIQILNEFLIYLITKRLEDVKLEKLLQIVNFFTKTKNTKNNFLMNYTLNALKDII